VQALTKPEIAVSGGPGKVRRMDRRSTEPPAVLNWEPLQQARLASSESDRVLGVGDVMSVCGLKSELN
jgi:hypothetical protein